jgi:hypothetical protein
MQEGREEWSKRAQELECDDETVERRGERRRVIGLETEGYRCST